MSIDILKDELKKKSIRNLYLFYGAEEYLKKYYLESIENTMIQEDFKALNSIVFEGKLETRKLIDVCETLPVFSDRKMVVVKNSGIFKPKKKSGDDEGKGKSVQDDLLAYLQHVPEYTCLVFYDEEVDKRTKYFDTIKKNGLIVEFPFQKPVELVKWVTKVFKSNRKEIDPLAASQLVDYSEQGMTELLNEINKLVLFVGSREKVNSSDIEKVCTKSVKSRIFDLTDAISERNSAKALKLLNDLVILKEPLPKILFMITRQFRQILELKLLCSSGMGTGDAAAKMGITPFAAGKIAKQAGSFQVDKLKAAIEECLDMDIAIKTGKIEDRIAAEMLIVKFTSKE